MGIGLVIDALTEHHAVGKENGHPQGRKEQSESARPSQGSVGDSFKGHCEKNAVEHGEEKGQEQPQDGVLFQDAPGLQKRKRNDADVTSGGKDLPMSKIDQLNNAVNHGITQGDQCINGTQGQSVKNLLEKYIHDLNPNSC